MNYHQRRREAENAIGVADIRPQDEYKDFLIHMRNLNQKGGSWVIPVEKFVEASSKISRSRLPALMMPTVHTVDSPRFVPYRIVEEPQEFNEFMLDVTKESFIAMDFEFHKQHSYNGFIATIQVATSEFNFLLDPFKLRREIMDHLVPRVIESTSILKVMCGLENDALFCQSNFKAFLVSAIDLQDIYNEWKIEKPTDCYLATKEAFREHIVNRKRIKNPKAAHIGVTEDEIVLEWEKNEPISYKKLVESLFRSHNVKIDKTCQLADFRVRPLERFAKYVIEDVHYLYLAFDELRKMVTAEGISKAFGCTKEKLMKTFSDTKYPSASKVVGKLRSVKTPEQHALFNRLHSWRDEVAKVMDEGPDNLMRPCEMEQLCVAKSRRDGPLPAEVLGNVLTRNKNSTTKKQTGRLLAILNNDQALLDRIARMVCHNCFATGHQGWSCPHPHDKSANKLFLSLPENSEFHQKQSYRRAKNRFRNTGRWNWGIPEPWKQQITRELEQEEDE